MDSGVSGLGSTLESKVARILKRRGGKLVPAKLLAVVLIILFLISLLMIALLGFAYFSILEKLASFNRQVYDRPGHDDKITKDALELFDELIKFRDILYNFESFMKRDVRKQVEIVDANYNQLINVNKTNTEDLSNLNREIIDYSANQNKSFLNSSKVCLEGDFKELRQLEGIVKGIDGNRFPVDSNNLTASLHFTKSNMMNILFPKDALFFSQSETLNKSRWRLVERYDRYHIEVRKQGGLIDDNHETQKVRYGKIYEQIKLEGVSGQTYSDGGGIDTSYWDLPKIPGTGLLNQVYIYDPNDTVDLRLVTYRGYLF